MNCFSPSVLLGASLDTGSQRCFFPLVSWMDGLWVMGARMHALGLRCMMAYMVAHRQTQMHNGLHDVHTYCANR